MATFSPRIDSHFELSELCTQIADLKMWSVTSEKKPQYSINFSLQDVGGRKYRIKIFGLTRIIHSQDDIMGKIPHESVCNLLSGESDMKLLDFGFVGLDSKLSPDFVSADSKMFVEVATTKSSDQSAFKDRFKEKMIHYDHVAKSKGYQVGVVVVGIDHVLTNLDMTQAMVNALCHRYRAGLAINGKLESLEGRSLQSAEATQNQRLIRSIVSNMSRKSTSDLKTSKHFPISEILEFKDEPKRTEMLKAAKLLKRCKLESEQASKCSEVDLQKYIDSYGANCRTDLKRVSNIPMVLPRGKEIDGYGLDLDHRDSDMPGWMKSIWTQSSKVEKLKIDLDTEKKEALGHIEFEQHRIQKSQCFDVKLDMEDTEEASTTGLWGKSMKASPKYVDHKKLTKESFHPVNAPTDDIEEFINRDNLAFHNSFWFKSVPEPIKELMEDAKKIWSEDKPLSLRIFDSLSTTKLVTHASMVTNLFTEICYCYKYWIKRADFYKKWCGDVQMLVRCVGDHVFVAYAFPKKLFEKWDTGKIGPQLFESRNYIFTDFCSYNEPTIEHFVKSGPYLLSTLIHLQSNMEVSIDEILTFDSHVKKTISGVYLLFLNNKTDVEELMTNQRYLNMVVMEELDSNPFKFVKRLPDMYRSRLTCYLFKRTVSEIMRFSERKPKKVPIEESGVTTLEYDWLKGIFSSEPLTLRQKINEFYFGYVVSKERGRGADRNFKIMKKIVEQEFKYRDDDHPLFTDGMSVKDNQVHKSMLKCLLHFYKQSLQIRFGDDWKSVMEANLVDRMASLTFMEIATLKVSSRSYDHDFVLPSITSNMTTFEIKEKLTKANPEDTKSRPKVMESLSNCVKQYLYDTKKLDITHIIEMVPWALGKIEKRGYFYSDIFPKPQHGGDREIHVLEFKARLIQLYVERLSRTLCEMTPSDSLTHPKLKESFVRNHYNLAELDLDSSRLTVGKSADASKWCQRNHASKFAAVLVGILPSIFHVSVLRILWFWTCKIIVFPIQFVANFLSNKDVESNKTYKRMQREFEDGTGIFPVAKQNRMEIQSGMMQGILHYTSSITHGVIQEAMKLIQLKFLEKKKIQSVISVIQGSDDSGQLISLTGLSPSKLIKVATTMLYWKEHVSKYISIYSSFEKSCIGATDLLEYNSEWSVRKTTYKPTFRWVSSSLEVGVVEKFIDRISNFYNTATAVLEGGGSVLETSVIQCCQSWMHYWMLGIGTHSLGPQVSNLLQVNKDPSLGYFPMDSDYCAGMPGLNFLLYVLYKKTKYGSGITAGRFPDVNIDMYEEDVKDTTISRDLRKIKLKFGNNKIFDKIVKGMDLPTLETLVEDAERDPELIYYPDSSWGGSKTRIYMKVFEPGVKESLSRHSATARILAASAYMISRPCLSLWEGKVLKKVSLLKALVNKYIEPDDNKLPISSVFIHHKEYEDILKEIDQFDNNMSVQNVKLRSRSKHQITIIDREMFDVSIIELCKQVWFERGGRTGLSSTQISRKWSQLKTMYPFLKDSRSATEAGLNMTSVQLKNFLDSLNERPRQITLLDSAAKGGSLRTVLSRVFWPSTKLHLKDEGQNFSSVSSLRSELFSVCTHWMPQAEKIRTIVDILSRSEVLESNDVPYRVKKLKIMRSAMEGEDKFSLISRILSDKLGVVGFFTISQSGWGWNRKGYGEWKGKILETSCVAEFRDSVCTKLTIDKISSPVELGRMMMEFITSTCSTFPTTLQDSDHWLTPDGRINGGRGSMRAIPITFDPDMKIRMFDELQDKEWILETSNNVIRLKAVFKRGQLITILSDKLGSYEWDPAFKVEEQKIYSNWNNSTPMDLNVIQHELNGILNGDRAKCLKDIRQMNSKKTSSGWDLGKFIECVGKFYSIQISEPDIQIKETPVVPLNAQEEDWMFDMITGNVEISDDNLTLWDSLNDDDDLIITTDFLADEADIDAAIGLLMEERSEKQDFSNNFMPSTNKCFSNLDILSRIYNNGKSFRQCILDFKKDSRLTMTGILGKIISLLLGEDRQPRRISEVEAEAIARDEESISLLTSVRTDAKAAELSETALVESIKNIDQMLDMAQGFVRDTLIENKFRLEKLLYMKKYPTKAEAIGDVKTTEFFIHCKPLLQEVSPRLKVACEMDNNFFFPILQTELDNLVIKLAGEASIAPSEEPAYRESIMKPNLTTLLVDLISELIGKPIEVGGYSTGDDTTTTLVLDI
ncbi:P1 [Grapevine associated cogu-like virus 1]|uniref:RNA-directed RNA polymerase L n=1 Tax=Grapevine associated cogu-like virus 1 TaxID=2716183 RepID=A0A6G7M579_9VIRU|nr:P1 [Grapevine associated cogu-like virus 1]QIJ25704.1 P1 [Grapevine associated cogu-like virus 1]